MGVDDAGWVQKQSTKQFPFTLKSKALIGFFGLEKNQTFNHKKKKILLVELTEN